MKYSNTALKTLSARYGKVLRKCAYLNAIVLTAAMIANPAMAGLSDVSSGNIAQGSGEAIYTGSTIDFNGNTYTFYTPSVGSTGTETLGLQLNVQSGSNTFKNGTLNVAKDRPQAGNYKMLIQNYADLTLDNMVVDGTNLYAPGYVVSHNNGSLNINNSTITASDNGIALDVYYWSKGYGTDDTIATVKDTTINGRVDVGMGETDAYAPDFSGTQAVLNLAGTNTINGTIQNNGIVNISDNLILNGTITKGGEYGSVVFNEGSTLKANLNGSTIIAGSSVTGQTALVLEGDANGKTFKIDGTETNTLTFADNTLYDITADSEATRGEKTWTVSKKSTEAITESLTSAGADTTTAQTVVAMTEAQPTNPTAATVANAITTAAQTGDTATVAALTEAINPVETPVVQQQSVAMANQIFSVAGDRMSGIGRSGGDINVAVGPWIQGLYNKTHNTQGNGFNGYSQGFAVGLDADINEHSLIGFGYGYTATDVKSGARKTQIYSDNIFLYGKYQPSKWYVSGIANYGHSNYKETSLGLISTYNVDSYSAAANVGYQSGLFDNYAGLRYSYITPDSYSNGLTTVEGKNSQVGTAVIGTKISKAYKTDGAVWKPEIRLAATYDIKSDNSSSIVGVVGGATNYMVEGKRLKRFAVEAGAGITTTVARNLDISFNYDANLRSKQTSQSGSVKLKYSF